MHKWVISIKVLRAVWKVNTIQSVIFEANYNKLPAYYGQYSSSCFKQLFEKKKKIQELISEADKLPSMSLASEGTENQLKAKPNEEDLLKEYLLHSRCDADCSRQVRTHVYSNAHIFLPN